MNLRPPSPDDTGALLAFFLRVPDGERSFFKERVVDRETVEAWLHAPGRRAIAIDGDAVVGHAEQDGTVAMFEALGFRAEGLLRDHVRDRAGNLQDLIVLAHSLEEQSALMTAVGIDEALR